MLEKVLTVAVPAFNVEQYLRKTLDSFIAQEIMDDLEVIIINDGSKDATADVAKEYENKYPQTFRLINKVNGGHGSGINMGLKLASGRYFQVVDGDDWVDTPSFVRLVRYLRTAVSDVVLCNYCEVENSTGIEIPVIITQNRKDGRIYQFTEVFQNVELGLSRMTAKTSLFTENHVHLDEHCYYVDMEYILYPVPWIQTLVYLDLNVYRYRIAATTQSTSMASLRNHVDQHTKVLSRLVDFLNQYMSSPEAGKEKVYYIACRLSQMYRAQIHIYLSYPLGSFQIRQSIADLENITKNRCKVLYQSAGNYMEIKMLRKTNYFGCSIMHWFLHFYKNHKKRD